MHAIKQEPPAAFPEPDVWWGDSGIDALIWADGQPYAWLSPCEKAVDSDANQGQMFGGAELPCR